MTRVNVNVDGVLCSDDVEPRTLLVQYLRDTVGKVGTVIGCDTSNCGACTVHLDGRSVKSCNVLAVQADGHDVTTIEGIATSGELHPMQQAFHDNHALQCGKKGDAHTIIITLSNLFTTPLHTGVPFTWKDLTPVARLALDQFILWVNTARPDKQDFKTAREYLAAVKERAGGDNRMKMGGTGSAQEDQIITIQVEQALGAKFTYVPFKGGGEVCVNLVGNHVDSTVNNPIECVSHWKAGRVRPLAVFDGARIPDPEWKDIPTVKEALGLDVQYTMLRGIFGPPDMPKEALEWYVGFLRKVYDTAEFKEYLAKGALKPAFATGEEYTKWVAENEALHRELMAKGGLLKK